MSKGEFYVCLFFKQITCNSAKEPQLTGSKRRVFWCFYLTQEQGACTVSTKQPVSDGSQNRLNQMSAVTEPNRRKCGVLVSDPGDLMSGSWLDQQLVMAVKRPTILKDGYLQEVDPWVKSTVSIKFPS